MIIEQKIGTLTKTSDTQVQLAGLSIVRLGGQFKALTSPTLLTSVSGIGGMDTGAIAASSFYYVYAVSTGSVEGLVASLSAISPAGFLRFKKVGAFYTDSGGLVFKAYRINEVNSTTMTAHSQSNGVLTNQYPANWLSGNFVVTSTAIYTAPVAAGFLSVAPIVIPSPWTNGFLNYASTGATGTTNTSISVRISSYTGVAEARGFHVVIEKNGVDAIQPDWKDY